MSNAPPPEPFIIAVGGAAGAPFISAPTTDGWLAWRIFLTFAISKHTVSVSCRHGANLAHWHVEQGFWRVDLEDA